MECVDEDLAPSQKEAERKAETEYQNAIQRVETAKSAASSRGSSHHPGTRAGLAASSRGSSHHPGTRAGLYKSGMSSRHSISTDAADAVVDHLVSAAPGRGRGRGRGRSRGRPRGRGLSLTNSAMRGRAPDTRKTALGKLFAVV